MIKLSKRDLKNETIALSPSYISNGHWAIGLVLIENAVLLKTKEAVEAFADGLCSFREMSDENIEKFFPKKRTIKVKSAGRILNSSYSLDPRHDRVVFADADGETCFDRRYVKLLRIADVEMYGDRYDGPFINAGGTIVLTPMRPQ